MIISNIQCYSKDDFSCHKYMENRANQWKIDRGYANFLSRLKYHWTEDKFGYNYAVGNLLFENNSTQDKIINLDA